MLSKQQLIDTLKSLELESSDTILVHSDLRGFGFPRNTQTREEILTFYYDSILSVIGEEGTLAVPAYFYEYARFGVPFDVNKSPVSNPLGSFSQWLTFLPKTIRSANPLQSIAAIGKRAFELCGDDSLSGYGVTSPWHKLRKIGGHILFLGAPLQSMTYVHYIEQQFGVPHLYFKIFPYPVIKNGKQLPGNPISAVRYLDYSVNYNLDLFQQKLMEAGVLRMANLNSIPIYAVKCEEAFQIGVDGLSKDPFFFLKHPPHFIPGKIPTDVIT